MGRETGGAPFWGVRLVPHPPAENPVHLPAFAVEGYLQDFSSQDVEIATSYAQGPSVCDLC